MESIFAVIKTTFQSMRAFQNADAAFHTSMPLTPVDKPLAAFERFALFGLVTGLGQDDALDTHLLGKLFIVRRIHATVGAGLLRRGGGGGFFAFFVGGAVVLGGGG